MREIVARGVEVGGVSTSVLTYSSLYAILSKEMETFDWLKWVGTVPSCFKNNITPEFVVFEVTVNSIKWTGLSGKGWRQHFYLTAFLIGSRKQYSMYKHLVMVLISQCML